MSSNQDDELRYFKTRNTYLEKELGKSRLQNLILAVIGVFLAFI